MTADGTRRRLALAILLAASATIAGALASEHWGGLSPCKLCLQQRWPYYLGVPLALATVLAPAPAIRRAGLAGLALIFAVSVVLAAYHAGVEWSFWPGPADCAAGGAAAAGTFDEFARSLGGARVTSCSEAAWRFLGLSLAGWNAVVSLALALAAAVGASRYGSSSVSQYR
jgi:disulfide bond formation protein DsbB